MKTKLFILLSLLLPLQKSSCSFDYKTPIVTGAAVTATLLCVIKAADVFQRYQSKKVRMQLDKDFEKFNGVLDLTGQPNAQLQTPTGTSTQWSGAFPQELETFFEQLPFYEKFKAANLVFSRGYLFHGQPGTGKTLLATTVAERLGIPFIELNSGDFIKPYQGSGVGTLQNAISQAHACPKKQPFRCVIFIDELDGLQKNRLQSSGEEERLVNALLAEITKDVNKEILFIGATNYLDKIDPALKRDGRLLPIEMKLPTKEQRAQMIMDLTFLHHNTPLMFKTEDFNSLVENTKDFSAATLHQVIQDALRESIVKSKPVVLALKSCVDKKRQEQDAAQQEPNLTDDIQNMYI